MIVGKLSALWALFRKGEAVSDPAAWKNGTIAANALAAFVLAVGALASSFGYDLGLNHENALQLAGGVLAGVNIVMHVITSKTVGLPPGRSPDDPAGSARQDLP